jgi:hypothetical protein
VDSAANNRVTSRLIVRVYPDKQGSVTGPSISI